MDYDKIVNDIANELGFSGVSEEKKVELIAQLGEALTKRIVLETFSRLGDAGMKEYDELLARGGTEEELTAFLKNRIPGYEEMIMKCVREFTQAMKEDVLGGETA